jgi:hypothetical protein
MAADLIKRDRLGYPLDTPAGKHPLDHFILNLVTILGRHKAALYLGIPKEHW